MSYLKKLEEKEQIASKESSTIKTIKVRAEWNEIENLQLRN